jgi:hypothetical protein
MPGRRKELVGTEAFASAEEAWFWTCGALQARREGRRSTGHAIKRPCEPDDVLMCVERLLDTRSLDRAHAQVLGQWGMRQMAPAHAAGSSERMLWRDAMVVLGTSLAKKGILKQRARQEFFP